MAAREILSSALIKVDKTQKYAAESIGMTAQKLWKVLTAGTLKSDDFLRILDNIGVDVLIQDDDGNEVSANSVSFETSEFLRSQLDKTHISKAKASRTLNVNVNALKQRLDNGTIKADDFIKLADLLDYRISYVVRSTGEQIKPRVEGYGRRAAAMVDTVRYNTANSYAISNNFFEDGEHEYKDGKATELYIDPENRYFFVEYHEDESLKDRIIPVPAEIAIPFIERYGTVIDKSPKTE